MALDFNDAPRELSADTRAAITAAVDGAKARGWPQSTLRAYFSGLGIDFATYQAARSGEAVASDAAATLTAISVTGLPEPDPRQIRRHLDWLTDPARGQYDDALVEIAWAPDPETGQITCAELFGLDELDAATAFAVKKNAAGLNLYVGSALKLPDTPRHHRTTGDAFYLAPAVPVDIDTDYDATRARMAGVCEDGLVVVTGLTPERRSQHWTRLIEPCDDDLAYGHAFASLVGHVGADMRVKDSARVMRLGGSVSYPSPAKVARGYRTELTTVTVRDGARPSALEALQALVPDASVAARFDASGRPSSGAGVVRDGSLGLGVGRVVDGREEHFRNLLLVAIRQFQEANGCDPDPEDVWTAAFAAFSDPEKVDNSDGRWTGPDGQKQLRARLTNTVRRWREGRLARAGLYSYETGIGQDVAERAQAQRQPPEPSYVGAVEAAPGKAVTPAEAKEGSGRPLQILDPWQRWVTPNIPLDALPPILRRFAEAQAMSTGADVNACAMSALAVCSAAIDHGFSLKMKRTGSWSVPPRLWVMLVGASSAKKTPALAGALAPLRTCDNDLAKAHAKEMARWQELKDAGDAAANEKPPPSLRLIVNDTTSEKLGDILSRQTRGLLVEQDELSGWLGAMDKYGGGGRGGASADRAFWLKAFDGGPRRIDRMSRGEVFVENCSVSLLGGIQPRKLEEMGNLTSDGLLQRFLPVMMRKANRPQEVASAEPFEAYHDLVRYLVSVRPCGLLLSDEALEAANRFQAFAFDMEAVDGLGESFLSFLGKLSGLHGSLMTVLHMTADPAEAPYSPVSGDTAEAAARILREFTIPHAMALYQESADGVDWDYLRSLASYVLTSTKDRFTVSDFTSGVRALRGLGTWEVGQKVSVLVAGGWLTDEEGRGGVVKGWAVVPGLREALAHRRQEEAARKAEVMRAYRELSGRTPEAA